MERANRGKQARAQRKLIEQLNVQVRALEKASGKTSANIEAPTSAAPGGKSQGQSGVAGAVEGGSWGGGGRRGASHRGKGDHSMDLDDLARLRRRKLRGDVLYSDEEDILVSLDTPLVEE